MCATAEELVGKMKAANPDDGSVATAITEDVIAAYQFQADEWVKQGWWFTGYNLSKAVQERFGKGIPRHATCKQIPHRVMSNHLGTGAFCRTSISLDGPEMPFLYHPPGADTAQYNKAAGAAIMPDPNAPAAPALAPTAAGAMAIATSGVLPVAVPPSGGTATPAGSRSVSGDRLNVPTSQCRAAGFHPGDTCYAYDDTSTAGKPTLTVTKTSRGGTGQVPDGVLAVYQVATDGRIRITTATLQLCGLEGSAFQIDGSDGTITVTAAT